MRSERAPVGSSQLHILPHCTHHFAEGFADRLAAALGGRCRPQHLNVQRTTCGTGLGVKGSFGLIEGRVIKGCNTTLADEIG